MRRLSTRSLAAWRLDDAGGIITLTYYPHVGFCRSSGMKGHENERRPGAMLPRWLFGLLTALAFTGACSEGVVLQPEAQPPTIAVEPPRNLQPKLRLSDTHIDFGSLRVGQRAARTLTITNVGRVPADLSVSLGGNVTRCASEGEPFCWAGPLVVTLPANDRVRITLEYRGDTPISSSAVEVRACEACEATRVTMVGRRVDAGLECSDLLDFGKLNPGVCRTKTVSCQSKLTGPVRLTSASLTASSEAWSMSAFEPTTLTHLQTATFDVTYCAPAEGLDRSGPTGGSDEATWTVTTDLRQEPYVFVTRLRARTGGPDIVVHPERLELGALTAAGPVRTSLTIRNRGDEVLTVFDIRVPGVGFELRTQVNGFVLPPGASRVVVLDFSTFDVGPLSGVLQIESSDPDSPLTDIPVSATGIAVGSCQSPVVRVADFGPIAWGRWGYRNVTLRNTGHGDCLLSSVSTSGPFSIRSRVPSRIPARGQVDLLVSVRVDTTDVAGALRYTISNRANAHRRVELLGRAVEHAPLVHPKVIDFGVAPTRCSKMLRTLRIHNLPPGAPVGAVPHDAGQIDVRAVRMKPGSSTAISVGPVRRLIPRSRGRRPVIVPLPRTVPQAESLEVDIVFSPSPGEHAGTVEVEVAVDGVVSTYVAEVRANVAAPSHNTETLRISERSDTDVLFVIDDSGTLSEELVALRDRFGVLTSAARAQGRSWQLGLTTTDIDEGRPPEAGRILPLTMPAIYSPEAPIPPEMFYGFGDNRTFTEKGLEGGRLAFSGSLIYGHNAGLLRPDAGLSVLYMSDEADQSAAPVQAYIDALVATKDILHPGRARAYALAGPVPRGCRGPGGNAGSGPRYQQIAEDTGGRFEGLCTTLFPGFEDRLMSFGAEIVGQRSSIVLARPAQWNTVEITVDGRSYPPPTSLGSGPWRMDINQRVIRFDAGWTPEPGAEVVVEYEGMCDR